MKAVAMSFCKIKDRFHVLKNKSIPRSGYFYFWSHVSLPGFRKNAAIWIGRSDWSAYSTSTHDCRSQNREKSSGSSNGRDGRKYGQHWLKTREMEKGECSTSAYTRILIESEGMVFIPVSLILDPRQNFVCFYHLCTQTPSRNLRWFFKWAFCEFSMVKSDHND